ncbi:putative glycerophosphodiester phosphodiesterase, protein kinase RLK-Pelle-LRK10L-2 family [Helianthus annuus]|nr:putative glycerophosphodiester phosphodiesterase, protein kinase RLK-Pelle-LRK10L-2 family [Helianthus annuus]
MSRSLSLLLLLLPFFFFFFITLLAQSNNSTNPSCRFDSCGNVNISYPFWKMDSDSTSQFCGYDGFGIRCSEQNIPKISLGGNPYYIRVIDYEYGTIFLSDYDVSPVVQGPNNCPRIRHGINLGNLPFVFVQSTVNISFHFDCNECPSFATEIPCLQRNGEKACLTNIRREESVWDEYSCDQEVVTTVFQDVMDLIFDVTMNFSSALEKGFGLRWEPINECQKCEESDGQCGRRNEIEFICFCSDGKINRGACKGGQVNLKKKLIIGVGSALLSFVVVSIVIYVLRPPSSNCLASLKHKTEDDKNIEAFVMHYGSLSTKRYTYNDIKKMTKSFKVKLGQGGFGQVFKGKLSDGRLVAVKVLKSSKANGQEFINEVASIGRTSHVNIVTLLGFCFEYKKRALVYEYMPNGSLEKFIYSNVHIGTNEHIGAEKMYEIALGIAYGLDYLHRGCNTRILHLDIKPHNILLDEDFCPKIADFGLAKLYSWKESIVSMFEARGTIGYIAPEVYNNNFGGVSHKTDVYSYGMLLLEMAVGGRKNVDAGVGSGRTSEIYFPDWIYSRLHKNEFLLDSLATREENDYARKMTIAGLWCIQPAPNQRPSINEVIEMLVVTCIKGLSLTPP